MTARLAQLQRLLQGVVTGTESAAALEARHAAGFASEGLETADASRLAAQDPRRLLVYRKLVRGNLRSAVRSQSPVAAALLGDGLDAAIDRFVEAGLPGDRVLRRMAYAFARHLAAEPAAPTQRPAHLIDVLRFELTGFDVACAEVVAPASLHAELAPDRAVALSSTARPLRLGYDVTDLSAEDAAVAEPLAQHLIGFRDSDGDTAWVEVPPLLAGVVERLWLDRAPLGAAVAQACAARGETLDDALVTDLAGRLSHLAELGVLLGSVDDAADLVPLPPDARWLACGDG